MDHDEAVRLHAAEKYLLGELPKAQHQEYEEHYFDCPSCAEELKATVSFMESARQVVYETGRQAIENKSLVPSIPRVGLWYERFLRPAFAIPAFAALLLFIGYQNGVTIPSLKQTSSHAATAEVVRSFSLLSVGSRGEGSSRFTIKVGPREDFGLDVDMPGNSPDGYLCEIQDEQGKVRFALPVSSEEAKHSVHFHIPGGSLQAGDYRLAIFTKQSLPAPTNGASAAQKPFTIEFIQ